MYRNLTNNRLSIKKSGLVLGHCDNIMLENPVFKVNQKGREYVRGSKRKIVHAYIQGEIIGIDKFYPYKGRVLDTTCGICPKYGTAKWSQITYNPYTHNHFLNNTKGQWIFKAKKVAINKNGAILAI